MSPARPQPFAVTRTQGAFAWLLAGLVFTLGLLTVSPEAHAYLHGESAHAHDHAAPAAHDDSGCAVTLFQQGVTTPLVLPYLETPRSTLWIATPPAARDALPLSSPRHRLRPVRGPPCIG